MHYLSRENMLTKINIRKNKIYIIFAQSIDRNCIILFNFNVYNDDVFFKEEFNLSKLNKINNSDFKRLKFNLNFKSQFK